MSSLVLYGAGGHAKVIYDIMLSNNLSLEYLVDDHHNSKKFYHFEVFKPQKKLLQGKKVIVAVGNPLTRERIVNDIQQYCEFATLVHHSSFVSEFSKLGEGTVVMPQACINTEVKIGKHCIINTSSVIDHDCLIEDFVHISPSVTLAGNVTVKKGARIGIGARVIPGITIGENAIVGAGTIVIKDVPDGATVVGNPGAIIKINEKCDGKF